MSDYISTIISKTTDAAQSDDIAVALTSTAWISKDAMRPLAHFIAPGLDVGESVVLQCKDASGNYHDYLIDGTLQEITSVNTGVMVVASGVYRLSKGATASAVSVEMYK